MEEILSEGDLQQQSFGEGNVMTIHELEQSLSQLEQEIKLKPQPDPSVPGGPGLHRGASYFPAEMEKYFSEK